MTKFLTIETAEQKKASGFTHALVRPDAQPFSFHKSEAAAKKALKGFTTEKLKIFKL
jgi:hypothetical protein